MNAWTNALFRDCVLVSEKKKKNALNVHKKEADISIPT